MSPRHFWMCRISWKSVRPCVDFCDERGLTVVIVSHDLNLASQYCDRVAMLRAGQVRRVGAPAEVSVGGGVAGGVWLRSLDRRAPAVGASGELRCRARVCRLVDEVVRCCERVSRPAPRVQ